FNNLTRNFNDLFIKILQYCKSALNMIFQKGFNLFTISEIINGQMKHLDINGKKLFSNFNSSLVGPHF
ncbi:MAG: hypothetical protein QOC38_08860, partial [Nitrososphaeraceae archaeon]|nr:hypothetical protein [Nitrososphaeraceae archaeon]